MNTEEKFSIKQSHTPDCDLFADDGETAILPLANSYFNLENTFRVNEVIFSSNGRKKYLQAIQSSDALTSGYTSKS